MNEFTLDINMMLMPQKLDYSSNSLVKTSDKIADDIIENKFEVIKDYIGEELFEQLSYSDKIFMSETAGSIDFGHPIDLDQIAKEIKSYDDY
jgi:predicted DNA-binding protein